MASCSNDADADADFTTDVQIFGAGESEIEENRDSSPVSLTDVLASSTALVKDIVEHCSSTCEEALSELQRRGRSLWLTTSCFSGLGAYEIATSNIHDELCDKLGVPPDERGQLVHYAVTDVSPLASLALDMHSSRTKALHRFTDVMGRCYPADLERLNEINDFKLEQGKIAEAQRKCNHMSRSIFKELVDRLGRELRDELCAVLEGCKFQHRLPCAHHPGQLCPVTPRVSPAYRDAYWSEASGHPCQPWSTLPHASAVWKGWFSPVTLPTLVYFFSTRYYEPDDLDLECVSAADHEFVNGILTTQGSILKSRYARDPSLGYSAGHSEVFSPVDFGLCTHRPRRYSNWHLKSAWNLLSVDSEERYNQSQLHLQIFMKRRVVTPHVFTKASPETSTRKMMRRKKSQLSPTAVDMQSDILSDAELARHIDEVNNSRHGHIETHWLNAIDQKLCSLHGDHFTVPVALVNLCNNGEHDKNISCNVVSTLCRTTVLYDLATRSVVPIEHYWLMMGHPHPACRSHFREQLSERFAFSRLEELSIDQQRLLLGNSMHLCSIEAWLLLTLARTTRTFR